MSEPPPSSSQHSADASKIDELILDTKDKIERCTAKYMSSKDTITYLEENYQINPELTKLVWDQLEEENPDFFKYYYIRCKTARQIDEFNNFFAQQVALMIKQGQINPSTATPPVTKYLYETPQGIRIMDSLGIGPQTVAPEATVPFNNCPRAPTAAPEATVPFNNCPRAPTAAPEATVPFNTCPRAPTAGPEATVPFNNCPRAPTAAPYQRCISPNSLADIGAPTVAQATPALDLSIFDYGGLCSFSHMDTEQLDSESENLLWELLSQEQPMLQDGISNGVHCEGGGNGQPYGGESIDQYFIADQLMQMYPDVDQQLNASVCLEEPEFRAYQLQGQQKRQGLESQVVNALHNNGNGASTSAQNQLNR